MQDANVKGWAQDAHVSVKMLESVHELNHRFLDLIVTRADEWRSPGVHGLSQELFGQVKPLSTEQRKAAGRCSYALFDLRFHDEAHWESRLHAGRPSGVADEARADDDTLDFLRLALFFAWHVAAADKLASRLLLGMSDVTVASFQAARLDCIPSLVGSEAGNLTARWSDCRSYWSALTRAASHPTLAGLRRVQLYGLQLTAATRLDLKCDPAMSRGRRP